MVVEPDDHMRLDCTVRITWDRVFAFDHQIAVSLDGSQQKTPVPHSLHYDVADNRVDIVTDAGAVSSLWWATKNEWLGLIDVAGFQVDALYGWFDKAPLTATSREYIFVVSRG